MKKKTEPAVIRIEINTGTFTIPAGDKTYEITVRQTPTISTDLDAIVTHESAGTGATGTCTLEELQRIALYKEISEEMFQEIGRLARDLSISIKDLPGTCPKEIDFEKAGLDLESAKNMLEEVVSMTETATMNIMDISEDMQEQCSIIMKTLEDVRTLNFVGNAVPGKDSTLPKDPLILMREMLLNMRSLRDRLSALLADRDSGAPDERAVVERTLVDIDVQIDRLEAEYTRHLESSERYMIVNDSYSMVKKEDHDRLIAALESSDHVIQCIIGNIGRILESLSFQDLSGQRIIKIVDLLSNVQVQLLSILITSGVKLKRLREGRALEKQTAEKEADELMSRFKSHGTAAEGKSKNILDQQAIDSLLSDLGF